MLFASAFSQLIQNSPECPALGTGYTQKNIRQEPSFQPLRRGKEGPSGPERVKGNCFVCCCCCSLPSKLSGKCMAEATAANSELGSLSFWPGQLWPYRQGGGNLHCIYFATWSQRQMQLQEVYDRGSKFSPMFLPRVPWRGAPGSKGG